MFFWNVALAPRLWCRHCIGGRVIARMPGHGICLVAGAFWHGRPTPRHIHWLGLLGCLVFLSPGAGLAGVRVLLFAAAQRLVDAGTSVTCPTAACPLLPLGFANVQYVLGHVGTQLLSDNIQSNGSVYQCCSLAEVCWNWGGKKKREKKHIWCRHFFQLRSLGFVTGVSMHITFVPQSFLPFLR